jgi:hypothetical protein
MKKMSFLVSAVIVIMLIITGCPSLKRTPSKSTTSYCQTETAIFLKNNLDPDKIIIENVSVKHYSGSSSWYYWTAITPDGKRYNCRAFSGDETVYCSKIEK